MTNLDEARTLKTDTEAEIRRLLYRFQQETGLTVQGIELAHHQEVGRSQRHVRDVRLEVTLP